MYALDRCLKDVRSTQKRGGPKLYDDALWRIVNGCFPKQKAFVKDPARRVAALVPGRGGKTTGAQARFLRRMLRTPKARCCYIAQSRDHASDLMWEPLKEVLDRLEVSAHWNETQKVCTLNGNGARLWLVGCDDKRQVNRLRGIPQHEIGIDEASLFKPRLLHELIHEVIESRLGDFLGSLFMISTPKQMGGPFWDITRPGSELSRDWKDRNKREFKDWDGWSTHRWSLEDGAKYVPAIKNALEEFERNMARNGWTWNHPIARREGRGEWAADASEQIFKFLPYDEDGNEWNTWDPEKDRWGVAKLPPGHEWEYAYGMDFGTGDPFCLQILAYSETSTDIYHACEVEVPKGMYDHKVAQLLLGEECDHENITGVLKSTGWPAAMVADCPLGSLEQLRNVYGIHIEPAEKKKKHSAIEFVNGDLLEGHLKILKDSRAEEQMRHLQWVPDRWGQLHENKSDRNDATDALTYARRKIMVLLGTEDDQSISAPKTIRGQQFADEAARVARLVSNERFDDADPYGNDDGFIEEDWP